MKRLKWALQIAVLVGSLVYLVVYFRQNDDNLNIVLSFDKRLLAAILVLQPLFYVLQSWRFHLVLVKSAGVRVPYLPWLRIFVLARFLNTLFAQAGNVYRGLTLKKRFGVSYTKYVGGYSAMTWLDTLMNLLLALVIILVSRPEFHIGGVPAWPLLAGLSGLILIAPPAGKRLLGGLTVQNERLGWAQRRLQEVVDITMGNLKDWRYVSSFAAIGLLQFARSCATFYVFFLCFDIQVSLPVLAILYAVHKLGVLLVLTPGNLGVQELVWGALAQSMGIGMAQGVLVSMMIRVTSTGLILILGFVCGGYTLVRDRSDFMAIEGDTNG